MKSALIVAVTTILTGCSMEAQELETTALGTQQQKLGDVRVESLKTELLDIAFANIDREDNLEEVRERVEPIIRDLAGVFGSPPVEQILPKLAGAWRQIWSDFPYRGTPGVQDDNRQVYQVVSPNGYYYNLGNQLRPGAGPLTGVLRGAYDLEPDQLRIRFTRLGFRFGHLDPTRVLSDFAEDLESGREDIRPVPGEGLAPNGPVNIYGTLKTLYIDDELRIGFGSQDPYLDEQGNVLVPAVKDRYFILQRVITPVP